MEVDKGASMRAKMYTASLCAAMAAMAIMAGSGDADAAPKAKQVESAPPQVAGGTRPRARITVEKRSFLDAGKEVLPGERKFTDYALPPGPSFGVQNNNDPKERQPFSTPSDLGGEPTRFPLY